MKGKVIAAAFIAFVVKLALAFTTQGSNDVLTWEAHLRSIETRGVRSLYIEGARPTWKGNSTGVRQQFNHPPFMAHVLRAWGRLASATGLPLRFWLRLTCGLADIAMLWLVCAILRAECMPLNASRVLPVALSPASIFISGFHGNTDPIMIVFLLLSLWLIVSSRPVWLAGAAFGLAMSIKIVPVLFLPVMLWRLKSSRQRVTFSVALAAVLLAGAMPYVAAYPALIASNVFGYTPGAGLWGFPLLALLMSNGSFAMGSAIGKCVAPALAILAAFRIQSSAPGCPLFVRCGLVASLVLFFAVGFGMQYLVWIVPWTAALSWKAVRWHYAVVAADLVLFYGAFSRWKWDLANTFDYAPPSIPFIGILQTLCWMSVGFLAIAFAGCVSDRGALPPCGAIAPLGGGKRLPTISAVGGAQ